MTRLIEQDFNLVTELMKSSDKTLAPRTLFAMVKSLYKSKQLDRIAKKIDRLDAKHHRIHAVHALELELLAKDIVKDMNIPTE